MADPLGLVYLGQGGTGAAFKAPWTSYDPYRAEVEAGEKRLAMMQKKQELDEKKKAEALKSIIASPVKYDPYVNMPNEITSKASDYITNLYATGQLDKIQPAANQIVSFSKSTANMINTLADMEKQLKMKAANDPKVITQELDANIDIMRNPHLAPREFYPEIAEMLEQNRQQAKQVQQTNPWMDDELAESYARARTSDQLSARFMTLPKEYTYEEWMPGMLKEAKQVMDANQQRILQGSTTRLTKDLTKEEADAIIDRNFMGNALYAGQMRREFAKLSDEERKEAGGDVLNYAKNKYRDALMGKVVLEGKTGGGLSLSFGAGAGAPLTTEEIQSGSFDTPVGRNEQGGTTTTVPVISSVPFNIAGTSGILDAVSPKYYYDFDYETGAFATGAQGTSDFATLKKIPTAKSFKFVLQNAETVPVTAKDLKFTVGNQEYTIPAGQILTRETVNLLNKYNVSVGKSDVKFTEMVKGTRDAVDVLGNRTQKTTYVPLEMIKGEIENQYKKANAAMPQIQTDPRSPVDVFGLIPGTTISGKKVSTSGGASPATQSNQFKGVPSGGF